VEKRKPKKFGLPNPVIFKATSQDKKSPNGQKFAQWTKNSPYLVTLFMAKIVQD
jgi:hypothetical protein